MTATSQTSSPRIGVAWATGTGLAALAVVLHATELSRSVAVAVLPLALCFVCAAVVAHVRGRWPSRPWQIVFAIVVVAAIAYGCWLYVYGQLHPPATV